jgi:8-oxo-dGTP pyrophosphatase MutT (NUDIX family)
VAIDVIDHPETARPARPAATVVLVRQGSDGIEVLMILRSSRTAFGGMWAFPGGAVEDDDVPPGTEPDPLPAARRAAVRETAEEVGLIVDEDALVWLSHWLPPSAAPVRFSTWFFVAAASEGVVEIDNTEVHEHRWVRPVDALAAHSQGEIELVTPTYVTLVRMAGHATVEAALDVSVPAFFATRTARTAAGVRACLYDGDAGYESGDCEAPGPRRRLLLHAESPWFWEDSISA